MVSQLHGQKQRLFWLRWRFDYGDGKPTKVGMWSDPGPEGDTATKAWCHNRGAVARAIIEGKNLATKEIMALAECPGVDFVNFEWMAAASVNPFRLDKGYTPLTRLQGLKLKTRDRELRVYEDGRVEDSDRQQEDLSFHYATFGR